MVQHHMEKIEIEQRQIIFSLVHSSLVVHCSYRLKFLMLKVTRRTASYPIVESASKKKKKLWEVYDYNFCCPFFLKGSNS